MSLVSLVLRLENGQLMLSLVFGLRLRLVWIESQTMQVIARTLKLKTEALVV